MLAMQYSIPLPLNYDAALIRDRVSRRRAVFDDHAGLVHKSFIYSEEDHLYAPFYLWKDVTEAKNFLLDDLFRGVVETFSRHRVRSWLVLSHAHGNRALKPAYARREIDPIPQDLPLAAFAAQECEKQATLLADPNLYMHLVALDADRWEVMHYSLWASPAAAPKAASDCVQDYGVLHVSEPGSFS
jgi:hypothetical protein